MNEITADGTASLVVSGDAASPAGVLVLPCPTEARGLASRAPERDEAGPRSAPARSGGRAMAGTLTAAARCLRGCGWDTEGPPAEVDKAAEKHARNGHPTTTAAWPGGRT